MEIDQVEHLSGAPLEGRLLALPKNIRPGQKGLMPPGSHISGDNISEAGKSSLGSRCPLPEFGQAL
jgi:hypothetical protein